MKRITGIGGIFFKSDNPDQLCEWYREGISALCSPIENRR